MPNNNQTVVVADVELLPHLAEPCAGDIGLLERCHSIGLGGALDLETVLVSAGEEKDIVAEKSVPASEGISSDGRVGVPDMGDVVDVIDRRSHIERIGHSLRLRPAPLRREHRLRAADDQSSARNCHSPSTDTMCPALGAG